MNEGQVLSARFARLNGSIVGDTGHMPVPQVQLKI
jgi:hypothetical protein